MKHTIMMVLVMGLLSIGLAGCGNDTATAPAVKGEASVAKAADADDTAAAQSDAALPGTPESSPAGEAQPDAETAAVPAGALALTPEALIHHRFVLTGIDGAPFTPGERVPELSFNEGFRIAAGICNRFTGQAELDGGVLKAGQMASTKMLCVDETLNALENRFAVMLRSGARVDFDGRILTLTQDGASLEWKLQDLVQ